MRDFLVLRHADADSSRYPELFHEIHAEPSQDKNILANDVADWILPRQS